MIEQAAEEVLANWIAQALSPIGQIPDGTLPARWVAAQFIRWWRGDMEATLEETLGDAQTALDAIRAEFERAGGWERFGEGLHECCHLADALGSLRAMLLSEKNSDQSI